MSASLCPDIRYSQNFLKDPRLVVTLLDASTIDRRDRVYEIGAGKGIVTRQLACRCRHVIAIEKDRGLAALLRRKFAAASNVTIEQGDCLVYRLPEKPYKVFANLPYNITSAVVARLTAEGGAPEDAYLTMQREAAEMWLGEMHESLRSVLLKPWFAVEVVHRFQRTDFVPAPHVDSVMLRLRKRGPPLVDDANRQWFRDFVVYGFTAWQPSLGDTLRGLFTWQQLKRIARELQIDLDVTPTAITFERWLELFERFRYLADEQARRRVLGSEKRLVQQQEGLQKMHRTRTDGSLRNSPAPCRTGS